MTIARSDNHEPWTQNEMGTSGASGQPPFNFQQGDFDITVLSDGFITIPGDILLSDGTADQLPSILPRLDTLDGMVRPKTNIPLIRKGEDLILIDIGAGHRYQPSDGMLANNLKLEGSIRKV